MLIVLGGLASLPREPYESAIIDGANAWHLFRHITLPLVWPYVMIAVMLRTIDALKVFDNIFVITQGGPGTASETINIFLYLQAFQFYKLGYASALVVVFFIIIVLLSLLLLHARQRSKWNALSHDARTQASSASPARSDLRFRFWRSSRRRSWSSCGCCPCP